MLTWQAWRTSVELWTLNRSVGHLHCAVQEKCQQLQRLADDASVALKNEYTIQLMKLPKKVSSAPPHLLVV